MASKYTKLLSQARVLVLGGSSGIGFSVAEHALELGAIVTISSSRTSKLDSALERLRGAVPDAAQSVNGQVCDLSDPNTTRENLESMLQTITKTKPLDHIVFTAGDGIKIQPVGDFEVSALQKLGNVRFIAPALLGGLAAKYMNVARTSSITFTSGTGGHRPAKNWTAVAGYCSGLEGLARGLAVELAPIRVNTVSPGAVHTEMFSEIPEDRLERVLAGFRDRTLTKSVGTPEELSEAYIYFMRCSYATGSLVEVNGGTLLA